ncbi:terminase large subunit domain-containing protein [Zunongwangia sp. HGR-M22]|uniref:terminase large subunit domain-containing protein n=1 Tax=Zunongwangia sp. HGR-M22 TaxID=3015168 RepID=UPI0022DDB591|nr:terminase family protein [Zunongwangia sp. HGR-M22]WBL25112.1 terminase family protein [Zunongwangia sp. HGR-M22]
MLSKKVRLNAAQVVAATAKQKQKYLEWGRGSGKTTYLGYDSLQLVKQMPRASFAMVGSTYSQILSRFMPAIKEGLELFGVYEGVDYVVGSMAGKKMGFKMPYQSPEAFNNIWHWSNGSIFQFVSLDHKDSGRGLNSYAIRGDEAALFDDEKLAINVKNTNRAKKAQFKNAPLLHSEVFTSSTPLTKKGRWFTEMEDAARKDPSKILFLKATARVNMANLRADYFEYMRQSYRDDIIYNAEMLNIRPREITDGFYPQLTADHYYTDFDNGYLEGIPITDLNGNALNCRQDLDVKKNEPLIISVDWGANINSMTVSQLQGDTYRVLKEFYVKSPKMLDHLFLEEFLPYYLPHPTKEVYFYYDRTGNNRMANSKMTMADQAKDILTKAGWTVYKMTTGANPSYTEKFRLINVALREDGRRRGLPKIRINQANCPNLIVSMENAEVYDRGKGLEKDKRSERRKGVDQEHATHLSDTFDYPFFSMFEGKLDASRAGAEDMPLTTF